VLDDLEDRAEKASPTLAAALARYDQAQAVVKGERASLVPEIDASGSFARTRVSADRPLSNGSAQTYNNAIVGGGLSYEVDLWGRIRASVSAARAEAQASDEDVVSARLSLQTSVADAYARLRGLDAEAELLRQTVAAFERAYDLTRTRHDGGIASGIDVSRALTVLGNARAQIAAVASQRAATEHEIAALVGRSPRTFPLRHARSPCCRWRWPPGSLRAAPAPARHRGGGAAHGCRQFADRRGAGRVLPHGYAWPFRRFPDHGRFVADRAQHVLGAGADRGRAGGVRRRAPRGQGAADPAQYTEQAEKYRQTVLMAFRQTEDALAAGRLLGQQVVDQKTAADAAVRSSTLALASYRDGGADYLEVVTAQTQALDAQRALLNVETQQMRASVALVNALGGAY
jgi:multidrug efflux system outer membrane protein